MTQIARMFRAILTLVPFAGCFACREISNDQFLDSSLNKIGLIGSGETGILLRSLTQFEWDEVFFVSENTSFANANRAIGDNYFRDGGDRYFGPGPLLVFILKGKTVKAIRIKPPLHLAGEHLASYTRADAMIFTTSQPVGRSRLMWLGGPTDAVKRGKYSVHYDKLSEPPN